MAARGEETTGGSHSPATTSGAHTLHRSSRALPSVDVEGEEGVRLGLAHGKRKVVDIAALPGHPDARGASPPPPPSSYALQAASSKRRRTATAPCTNQSGEGKWEVEVPAAKRARRISYAGGSATLAAHAQDTAPPRNQGRKSELQPIGPTGKELRKTRGSARAKGGAFGVETETKTLCPSRAAKKRTGQNATKRGATLCRDRKNVPVRSPRSATKLPVKEVENISGKKTSYGRNRIVSMGKRNLTKNGKSDRTKGSARPSQSSVTRIKHEETLDTGVEVEGGSYTVELVVPPKVGTEVDDGGPQMLSVPTCRSSQTRQVGPSKRVLTRAVSKERNEMQHAGIKASQLVKGGRTLEGCRGVVRPQQQPSTREGQERKCTRTRAKNTLLRGRRTTLASWNGYAVKQDGGVKEEEEEEESLGSSGDSAVKEGVRATQKAVRGLEGRSADLGKCRRLDSLDEQGVVSSAKSAVVEMENVSETQSRARASSGTCHPSRKTGLGADTGLWGETEGKACVGERMCRTTRSTAGKSLGKPASQAESAIRDAGNAANETKTKNVTSLAKGKVIGTRSGKAKGLQPTEEATVKGTVAGCKRNYGGVKVSSTKCGTEGEAGKAESVACVPGSTSKC
ncbi:uncharacterized protein LOC143031718 isoform X2 [Oratosquilla oratoria]|uniref:uncharacterized protein LOC143031718 isoform X2 n=1 Tax=Oratosquilla oratoria TaxID=337810 RepID=UPI003F776CCC